MVQIFVKMNGSRVTPMEVNLTNDKVEDVMKRIQSDEDAYVTMQGKVLRRDEKLRSCGVTDGCTVQVTSRLRGGGKHKDKKGQKERKRAAKSQGPEQKVVQECDRDAVVQMIEESDENRKVMVRMLEENEDNRKMIESICEGSDAEVEQALENYRTAGREVLGWDQGQADLMKRGLRWAVEARRKGRRQQEQEQWRQEEQEEEQRRQEEQEEEQQRQEQQEEERRKEQEQRRQEEQEEEQRRQEEQRKTRAESTDEPEVTSRPVEVRTGRGSTGLVRGGDGRHLADESNRTGKGKGNGGKGEHGGKGGVKGGVQVEEEEYRWDAKRKVVRMMKREEDQEADEEGRGRVAPNMGAGGSHPQATSDPGNREEEKREARVLCWADCKDEEETTEERPPGLEEEEVENDPKTRQKKKLTQVESEQEAQEEERKAQEAREDEEKKAQEAREERKRAQEAREEQRRAQEAREEQRAQEAQEKERRAQEAREDEERKAQEERERLAREAKAQEEREREAMAQEERERKAKAQEEREKEVSAHEERKEQDREAEVQGEHEGEVKAQGEQGENANSLHEESHVSNRHMTWWRNAWWIRVENGPHMQTARGRRQIWRAARRAAEQVCDDGRVEETRSPAEEADEKTWGQRKGERQTRRLNANTLHLVIHLPATSATATAVAASATAASAEMRLQ